MNWASVKDALPSAGQTVVCVGVKGGFFLVCNMREGDMMQNPDGIGVWHGGKGWRTFTHWMAVPDAPEAPEE